VVHAYNPSYSGGREQEDLSSKPAKANSPRPYLEKTHHIKRSGRVAQGVGPEFKPQYHKKKKKEKTFSSPVYGPWPRRAMQLFI
jgi:hypothetical protein